MPEFYAWKHGVQWASSIPVLDSNLQLSQLSDCWEEDLAEAGKRKQRVGNYWYPWEKYIKILQSVFVWDFFSISSTDCSAMSFPDSAVQGLYSKYHSSSLGWDFSFASYSCIDKLCLISFAEPW